MQFHKFIQENISNLLRSFPDQSQKQQTISNIRNALKSFVKSQSSIIQKDLANKTRQNFIFASDNSALKQKNKDLQDVMSKLKQQKVFLEQSKTKLKLLYQEKIQSILVDKDNMAKQYQKTIAQQKHKYTKLQDSCQDKIKEMRKDNQNKIVQTIQNQRKIAQQMLQKQKLQFQQEKQQLLQQAQQQRSKLIKKYQTKIHEIEQENQRNYDQLEKKMNEQIKSDNKTKQNLHVKISTLTGVKADLQQKLNTQTKNHQKYFQLYEKNKQEFQKYREGVQNSHGYLKQKIDDLSDKLLKEQKLHSNNVRNLKKQLVDTIQMKDKLYIDTVEIMNIEFNDKISTLQTNLIQEKQLVVNQLQTKSYQQLYQAEKKYEELEKKYQQMQAFYKKQGKQFYQIIDNLKRQNEETLKSIQMRLQYQLGAQSKNGQRQLTQQMQKYQLQIVALRRQNKQDIEDLMKKMNDQKLGALNKLTGQYQSMITDIKGGQQVQLRQKVIEFQRRLKGYDKKLAQAEKRKTQLKLLNERIKMQMQMKIDSMIEVNKNIQTEIFQLQDKIQDLQNQKSRTVSEYQLKIVIVKNQMQQIKDDYAVREEQMKDILDTKLTNRNKQINRLTQKLKKQTIQLIKVYTQKYQHLQKQYKQLKNVVKQKTSLPQDIQALKTFHAAFIQRQQQLKKQKQLRVDLQRQLKAKDAMDKIFANKGMRNTMIRQVKLTSFQSHQL